MNAARQSPCLTCTMQGPLMHLGMQASSAWPPHTCDALDDLLNPVLLAAAVPLQLLCAPNQHRALQVQLERYKHIVQRLTNQPASVDEGQL